MLRSGSPDLVRQELAAWAAGTEMTRGVARDAALAAVPARKGRRAGQPVRPREISHARTRRADPHRDPRRENRLRGADQGNREIPHHRRPEPAPRPQVEIAQQLRPRQPRRTPSPASPPPSSPWPTSPPDQRRTRQANQTRHPPARGAGRQPARHAGLRHARTQKLLTVTKPRKPALAPKCLNPMALRNNRHQSGNPRHENGPPDLCVWRPELPKPITRIRRSVPVHQPLSNWRAMTMRWIWLVPS